MKREAQEEARALGRVALSANGAAVFLHNFGCNGEAQPGAAVFGGVERQEQPLADFFGEAMTGVRNCDFNGRAIFRKSAAHAEHAEQAALHGLGGVVDEVGQRAADGFRIGENRRKSGSRSRLTVMPSSRPANKASASSAI